MRQSPDGSIAKQNVLPHRNDRRYYDFEHKLVIELLHHQVTFEASGLSRGVYLYRLQADAYDEKTFAWFGDIYKGQHRNWL